MGNLMKGIRIAAYVAEVIIASSVVIELVESMAADPRSPLRVKS